MGLPALEFPARTWPWTALQGRLGVQELGSDGTMSRDVSWEEEGAPGAGVGVGSPCSEGVGLAPTTANVAKLGLPTRGSQGEVCCQRSDGPVHVSLVHRGWMQRENRLTLTLDLFTVGGQGWGTGRKRERERERTGKLGFH